MELQYFLVHSVGPSSGFAFPMPDSGFIDVSVGRRRTFGRNSPELRWCVGNDPRCSRHHMSVAPAPALPGVEVRCLGRNPLTIHHHAADSPQRLHRGNATVLRPGDRVGVTERAWFVAVIARMHVSCAASDAPRLSAEPSEPSVPLVAIGAPWHRLPRGTRAAAAAAAARRQCQCLRVATGGGTGSSEARSRGRQFVSPSGTGAKRARSSPPRMPLADTYEERFDAVVCELESRAAVFDPFVVAQQVLCGDSPLSRSAPAMVSRAQLEQNAAETETDATVLLRPRSDESQVVYYHHHN